MQMRFQGWGMSRLGLKFYLNLSHKALFICFMFSRPFRAFDTNLLPLI
jgi:hypothetical protein